jgi:hypothetical protein
MKKSELDDIARTLEDLGKRVTLLEDEIFPKGGGGFGVELKQINDRLRALEDDIVTRTVTVEASLNKKFKELVEIVAELKQMVAKLESSADAPAREMVGFAR